MRESVALDDPVQTSDGFGGKETAWIERFTCPAEFRYERGAETIEAGGLTGTASFKVKIRSFSLSQAVTTDYRLRDVRRSIAYNVREVDAVTDPMWVWLVVERGVAI